MTISGSSASLSTRTQVRTLAIYMAVAVPGVVLAMAGSPSLSAFGMGLMLPGGGFLAHLPSAGWLAMAYFIGGLAAFGVSVVLWFGTGNVLAPPLTWLVLAIIAAATTSSTPAHAYGGHAWHMVPLLVAAAVGLLWAAIARRTTGRTGNATPLHKAPAAPVQHRQEMDDHSRQLARLLLDRSLQPVDEFEGFEWRDQFQTAAIRYQITFMSHALSMAQARWTPAFDGYALEAQRRLLAKQADHRVWRYWSAENAWGNLRLDADPVPCGNIMYTGFVATQIALAEASLGRSIADGPHLALRHPRSSTFDYGFDDMVDVLTAQYQTAPWGLLGCEPHWIYPLCNAITSVALLADETRRGNDGWSRVSGNFRRGLDEEFTTRDGRIIPFRSSITGIPSPRIGGAVIQALPCLYLNATLPDVAARQWDMLRDDLASKTWRRAFWPIDVGNYGFSRASSLAASAAAAAEMGDDELMRRMLAMLDDECPATTTQGAMHRRGSSLWAHAMELTALAGGRDAMATLASRPVRRTGPRLLEVPHPAMTVTRAVSDGEDLRMTIEAQETGTIAIGALHADVSYHARGTLDLTFTADGAGSAVLHVPTPGRHELHVTRTA